MEESMDRNTKSSLSRSGRYLWLSFNAVIWTRWYLSFNSRAGSRIGESFTTGSFNLSKVGSKSRSNLYSGSRRGLYSESKPKIHSNQILDESGNDVTPKPLIQSDQPTINRPSLRYKVSRNDYFFHHTFTINFIGGMNQEWYDIYNNNKCQQLQ